MVIGLAATLPGRAGSDREIFVSRMFFFKTYFPLMFCQKMEVLPKTDDCGNEYLR